MSIVDFLSSDIATAIANLIMVLGLAFTTAKYLLKRTANLRAAFATNSKIARRNISLQELRKIRAYQRNPMNSWSDFFSSLFNDIILLTFMGFFSVVFAFNYISYAKKSDLAGPDGELWKRVIQNPLYWWDLLSMAITLPAIVVFLIVWGLKYNLRILRLAGEPEAMRREIISKYVRLQTPK